MRRLFSIALLLMSLAFAGVPAIACAADRPMHDCCPSEPHTPCPDTGSGDAAHQGLSAHCAQALATPSALSVTDFHPEIRELIVQPNVPASPVSWPTNATYQRFAREFNPFSPVSAPPPTPAPLYLSTGRLRL